jgi:hypothetical protein
MKKSYAVVALLYLQCLISSIDASSFNTEQYNPYSDCEQKFDILPSCSDYQSRADCQKYANSKEASVSTIEKNEYQDIEEDLPTPRKTALKLLHLKNLPRPSDLDLCYQKPKPQKRKASAEESSSLKNTKLFSDINLEDTSVLLDQQGLGERGKVEEKIVAELKANFVGEGKDKVFSIYQDAPENKIHIKFSKCECKKVMKFGHTISVLPSVEPKEFRKRVYKLFNRGKDGCKGAYLLSKALAKEKTALSHPKTAASVYTDALCNLILETGLASGSCPQ